VRLSHLVLQYTIAVQLQMCIECWWNGNWQGKIEVATEKICLNVTLYTTSPTGMALTDETEPELPQ